MNNQTKIPEFLASKLQSMLYKTEQKWSKLTLYNKHKQPITFTLNRGFRFISITNGKFKNRHDYVYYGKLEVNTFKTTFYKLTPENTRLGIISILSTFIASPIKYAKMYGDKEHKCMFCHKKLTHEDSIYNGYGAICASRYGLNYQSSKAALTKCKIIMHINMANQLELEL